MVEMTSHKLSGSFLFFLSLLAYLVKLVVLGVGGGDEEIVADVLQVTAELEPGTGSRNVVGCALSFHLVYSMNE